MSEGRRSRNGQQASPTPRARPRREAMSAHSFSYSSRSGSASRSGWKKMRLFSPKRPAGHLPAAYGTGEIGHLRHNVLGLRHGLDRAGRFTVAARHVHVQQGQRKPFALTARPRQMGKEIAMPQEPGQRIGRWNTPSSCPSGGRVLHAQPLLLLKQRQGVVGLKRPRGIAKVQDLRHGFRFTDFQQDDLCLCRAAGGTRPRNRP